MTKSVVLRRMTGNRFDEFKCCEALDTAEEIILNYCGTDYIPEALNHTVLHIASDILVYNFDNIPVKSVTVGDARAEFSGSAEGRNFDKITERYKNILNRFRRLNF